VDGSGPHFANFASYRDKNFIFMQLSAFPRLAQTNWVSSMASADHPVAQSGGSMQVIIFGRDEVFP